MDVSVIVINYNTFQLTSECIRSIYQYTTGITFEIILVDNASTECSADLFKNEFPELNLLKNDKNVGFSRGNNQGIEIAKGDVILLLNSDTKMVEDAILRCFYKLNDLKNTIAAISCKLIYPDGMIQGQCSRFPSIKNEVCELLRLQMLLTKEKRADMLMGAYFDNEADAKPDWFWGTFFMFRKDTLNLLPHKKLNDDYFMYCEDMRWCYDFRQSGKEVYYYSGAKVVHLVGKSADAGDSKTGYIVSNEMDFVRKIKGKAYALFYGIARAFNILWASSDNGKKKEVSRIYMNKAFKLLSTL